MRPFAVVLMGVSRVAVPEAAQVLARAPEHLVLFCFAVGAVAAGAAATWGLLIHVMAREDVAELPLGSVGEPAAALLYAVLGGRGACLDGARGSWGVAVATAVGAGVWWLHLRRGAFEHITRLVAAGQRRDAADGIPT